MHETPLLILAIFVIIALWQAIEWYSKNILFLRKNGIYELYRSIITPRIPYFNALSEDGKKKFIKRVFYFMKDKKFEGREGVIINDEMKILISASAVQLTFGFKNYLLYYFNKIIIYPEEYFFRNELYKGATTKGTVMLSWKNFIEGYADGSDKINLGLHELAHALELDIFFGNNYNVFFASYYDEFRTKAEDEIEKTESTDIANSFLRNYSYTNVHEFFAASVEAFFENPHEFQKAMPRLYLNLCVLMNQDPANSMRNDYTLTPDFTGRLEIPGEEIEKYLKENRTSLNKSWNWSFTAASIGIFIGSMTTSVLCYYTIINLPVLLSIISVVTIVSLFAQYNYYKRNVNDSFPVYLLYSIFGIGVNTMALILLINFLIVMPGEVIYNFKVIGKTIEYDNNNLRDYSVTITMYNEELDNEREVTFKGHSGTPKELNAIKISVSTRDGLFGFPVIKDEVPVYEEE
ncbi:MAG: zinc-dependent peptidase [Bacteroidales bacterium]|nr:zinc-dependent peptidase [Bacteroidales bacterium]